MPDILAKNFIRLFVYGTLRKGQRLDFYMQEGIFKGYYFTRGQLMKSPNGSVFIENKYQDAITIGELYYVNFYCLQRINHLEAISGEFPQGYELHIRTVWPIELKSQFPNIHPEQGVLTFYYRRKNTDVKILTGDFNSDFEPIEELERFLLKNNLANITDEDIINYMHQKMLIWEFEE